MYAHIDKKSQVQQVDSHVTSSVLKTFTSGTNLYKKISISIAMHIKSNAVYVTELIKIISTVTVGTRY